jgi:hypothetical protein
MSIDPKWLKRIADAQRLTHTFIGGQRYERVKHGADPHFPGDYCGDCGCEKGQYHVRGCDVEQCPRCGGAALCCSCHRQRTCRR